MKKRNLALALVICMLLAFSAGCSKSETEETNTASTGAVSSEQTSVSSSDASAQESNSAVTVEAEEFPFCDSLTTLSVWTRSPSGNKEVMSGTYSDYGIFTELETKTNVHIEWNECTNEAASTQFSLMCASGAYTDIITAVNQLYTGGLSKAYEDGVIEDMRDLISNNALNYTAILNSEKDIYRECINDDGTQLAFFTVNDAPDVSAGMTIRQDWLDALGLQVPKTYDDVKNVLTAFKTEYNCTSPLLLTESCVLSDSGDFTSGFGVSGFNVKEINRYHLFINDGKVSSCLVEEGYKEYLAYMADLYKNGLIDSDFYSISSDSFTGAMDEIIANSQSGIFRVNTRGVDSIIASAVDSSFDLTPIADVGTEADHVNHFSDASLVNTNASASISSTCADSELAVKWLDYWYSDEGMLRKNYGVESESYEMVDGEPQFTDTVNNNQWGVTVDTAITHWNIQNQLVGRSATKLTWDYYTEFQQNAKTLWSETSDSTQVLPGSLSPTTEESELYASKFTDIATYVSTMIPQFIMGESSLDSDWDSFQSQLKEMGIDDCINVYQQAYDRYLAR